MRLRPLLTLCRIPFHRQPLLPHAPQRIPRWLERGELFLRVLLRMYIGLAVCYAPWSHMFWDQNPLFLHFPTLADLCGQRSGAGTSYRVWDLLNLWIAFRTRSAIGTGKA